MSNAAQDIQLTRKSSGFLARLTGERSHSTKVKKPFWVIVEKEISDQVRSWRFVILIAIIALTTFGSLYTVLTNINDALKTVTDPEKTFLFLKLFTYSDGTLPSFIVFVSFLGPLLGIGLGFDAVNSEQNRGTLSRILAQPIHRDYIINAKFIASLIVIGLLFFALGFMVMGIGIIVTGLVPTPEEFIRIVMFLIMNIIYVGFWLNLSIFLSVRFKQPATSALTGISIWIFFSIFYSMIVNLIIKAITSPALLINPAYQIYLERIKLALMRFAPNELFSEATSTLMMPSVRSLGPLTMEQLSGAIPGPLPVSQSLLLVWPHITALIAASAVCFVLAYVPFMRREIRSR
jgi:ABC-2 type transport system permease protein